MWKEAFLHPKDAPGVVVQLAQSAGEWASPSPEGFPSPRSDTATLEYVGHGVTRLDDGLNLFGGLLDGQECGRGHDDLLAADWVELAWPGPGRVRLLVATDASSTVSDWIGAGAGRLHHLAFRVDAPDGVPDAKPVGDGRFEVAPELNLGTRLLLS